MAERSFAKEVQDLRIGAGQEFRGEGILAITKALLECGVGYVGGYPGAPVSHLIDVLSDAEEILGELGVHFEANASEAAAAAMLAASVNYPIRGAVTFKGPVGANVAADALTNLSSGGVTGGALVILGEDYGEGSSIMQERTHAFATKSQLWLLDPRPNLPSIVKAVRDGFELSEASNTPVILEVRIRACHVYGAFEAEDNRRPPLTVREALENPQRRTDRIALPPNTYRHEIEKVTERMPAARRFIQERGLNERFGRDGEIGIILQGGMYNGVVRALQRLGLADAYGESEVPLYVLNVTYPLVDAEVFAFCEGKKAVLVVEEGQPAYIEDAIAAILYRAGATCRLAGKGTLPMAGEYTGAVLMEGVTGFLRDHGAEHLPDADRAPNEEAAGAGIPDLSSVVPIRPPGFCTGCPERPIFAATKLVEEELGAHHIASDIGCHLFSILPPFEIGSTTMGYGLGPASAAGLSAEGARRSISFIGDGGFWHNGPHVIHRQRGLQRERRRDRGGGQLLRRRHRGAGRAVLPRQERHEIHPASDCRCREGPRRQVGEADRPYLRRGAPEGDSDRGADDAGDRAEGHHRVLRVHAEQAAARAAGAARSHQGRRTGGRAALRCG